MAKPLSIRYYCIMVRRCIPSLLFLAILSSLALAAQTVPAPRESAALPVISPEESIFAPFPLRIRVGTKDAGIFVTWAEAADPVGGYSVYRSEEPIDRKSFPRATRLVELPPGSREYLDTSGDGKGYFYAVMGRTQEGGVYEVFIPLKNVSIAPVAYVPPAAAVPAAPKTPEPPPVIRAESVSGGIRIAWNPVREGRRVVLYRSPSPIRSLSDLLTASWVASSAESADGLTDYPVPGIGYYYALVDDEGLRSGIPELVSGRNVTTESVSVPPGLYRVGLPEIPYASRSLPLPFLSLTRGVESGAQALPVALPIPPPASLKPETEKSIAHMLRGAKERPVSLPELTILSEDLDTSSAGGEEYTLRTIVRDRLVKRDWSRASDELARYLSLNRGPAAAARARYYRGEALAFSGQYREAFFEFLLAQDRHYQEANIWIDWLLDRMPAPAAVSGR